MSRLRASSAVASSASSVVANVHWAVPMKSHAAPAALLIALLSAAALGCTTSDHGSGDAAAAGSAAGPAAQVLPPNASTPVHGGGAPVTGTIAETMNAGGYTYVRLTTPTGDQWAAIPQTELKVGDPATIVNSMVVDGFTSPTLKRTFDHILFGTLQGQQGAPGMQNPGAPPHPMINPAPSSSAVASGPVSKATGTDAHTVAEIVKGKDALKDKSVTIHARVVKVNNGILGKNWLHIQDGSGKDGSNDLTVTTSAAAKAGDTVVVSGKLTVAKDFGYGYQYDVIIEDAQVVKE